MSDCPSQSVGSRPADERTIREASQATALAMALGGEAPHPPAVPAGAGHAGGSRGRYAPLADRDVKHRVGWLRTSKRVQSQPFGRPRKATLGTARNCGHPTVAGKLPGLLAVCLDDGDDDGRPVTLW